MMRNLWFWCGHAGPVRVSVMVPISAVPEPAFLPYSRNIQRKSRVLGLRARPTWCGAVYCRRVSACCQTLSFTSRAVAARLDLKRKPQLWGILMTAKAAVMQSAIASTYDGGSGQRKLSAYLFPSVVHEFGHRGYVGERQCQISVIWEFARQHVMP